ncbi:hypothetical protein Bca101_059812 [Brassica carinata]
MEFAHWKSGLQNGGVSSDLMADKEDAVVESAKAPAQSPGNSGFVDLLKELENLPARANATAEIWIEEVRNDEAGESGVMEGVMIEDSTAILLFEPTTEGFSEAAGGSWTTVVLVFSNIAILSVLSVSTVSGRWLSSPSSGFGTGNPWNSDLKLTSPRSSSRSVLYPPPKASMKTSLLEDSLGQAHVLTPQPHRTSTGSDDLAIGNLGFPLLSYRTNHVPRRVMYSSLLLQTVSTGTPFAPYLAGHFFDSDAVSFEDGFVSFRSRPVVSPQASDEYNRIPVDVPRSFPGGLRGLSFPYDLNPIVWASSSSWASSVVLGHNLSYIVKCIQHTRDLRLHHQCRIRRLPPNFSSILVFSVSKTIMDSEMKISSTTSPFRSLNSVLSGSIEIHLVSRSNTVGVRADIIGLRYLVGQSSSENLRRSHPPLVLSVTYLLIEVKESLS